MQPVGDFTVTALRMPTGALGAVFGKRIGLQVTIATPTVAAGIHGAGCYMESRREGTYFCTRYGAIELTGVNDQTPKELIDATHHEAKFVPSKPRDGQWIGDAKVDNNHTDIEMDILEKCVGRRAPWFTGGPNSYKFGI